MNGHPVAPVRLEAKQSKAMSDMTPHPVDATEVQTPAPNYVEHRKQARLRDRDRAIR